MVGGCQPSTRIGGWGYRARTRLGTPGLIERSPIGDLSSNLTTPWQNADHASRSAGSNSRRASDAVYFYRAVPGTQHVRRRLIRRQNASNRLCDSSVLWDTPWGNLGEYHCGTVQAASLCHRLSRTCGLRLSVWKIIITSRKS